MFKVGDVVKLISTGKCYDTHSKRNLKKEYDILSLYIKRYKPINARRFADDTISLRSGYATYFDLSKDKDLRWKVKYIFKLFNSTREFDMYLISSNKRHALMIGSKGIKSI